MIEKPNISDERIISALQESFSIPAMTVEFLPLGLDSSAWSYRVHAENGTYFLKIRKEIPNPEGILIPRLLKEKGIEQVIVPLSTKNGEAWATTDDFFFIVYPFITGQRVMDIGMSDAHWMEFGSIMKKLHTVKLTSELASHIKRERFMPQWIEWIKEIHAKIKSCEYNDPFQKELAELWRRNYSTISTILERTEALARRMQKIDLEFVLCHADIHTANLLLTEDDKIFIVDWDDTMLAPKERDLLFVMGSIFGDASEGEAEQLFFEGYGKAEVNSLALAYYRYDWCVEDMGGFAEQIFTTENVSEETKKSSIWWFNSLFSQGNSVETALNTEIEF
jgi:spectinomycin phosphotransferase